MAIPLDPDPLKSWADIHEKNSPLRGLIGTTRFRRRVPDAEAPGRIIYAIGSWLASVLPEWEPGADDLNRLAWWLRCKTNSHIELWSLHRWREQLTIDPELPEQSTRWGLTDAQHRWITAQHSHLHAYGEYYRTLSTELQYQPSRRQPMLQAVARMVTTLHPVPKMAPRRISAATMREVEGRTISPIHLHSVDVIVERVRSGELDTVAGYPSATKTAVQRRLLELPAPEPYPFNPPPPDADPTKHPFADFRHVLDVVSDGKLEYLFVEPEAPKENVPIVGIE